VALKAVVFLLLLFVPSWLGSAYLLACPLLFLLPVSAAAYRFSVDWIGTLWFKLCIWGLEYFWGIEVVFSGDAIPKRESAILISNHPTRLDWMFLWMFIYRLGALRMEKIILKASLKNVFGFGWAMQAFHYVFLQRKWEDDQSIMKQTFAYFRSLRTPIQILLYPEGSDLSPSNKEKDQTFSREKKIEVFEHLLHVRTKGWELLLEELRGNVSAVYDITVAYPDVLPQTEQFLLSGNMPKHIHIHVQRYSISALPKQLSQCSQWLQERWSEKESRLKQFYATANRAERSLSSSASTPLARQMQNGRVMRTIDLWLHAIFWFISIPFLVYITFSRIYCFLFVLIYSVVWILVCKYFGGMDAIERRLHLSSEIIKK